MIRRRTNAAFSRHRRRAENLEEKWFVVLRDDCGIPPPRPSEEDKTYGRTNALLRKEQLEAALGDEQKGTVKYVLQETTPPRRRPARMGSPKWNTSKVRSR